MEITIQAKSKDPQIVSLDLLPRGKFKDRLTSELGEKTSRKILLEMPKEISEKYRKEYFKGLDWYIQAAQNGYIAVGDLSPDELFSMAVVAYFWDDVGPLQRFAKRIMTLADKCYWVYLAEEPELFFATVEVEMYRRRITRDLEVLSLSKNNGLEFKELYTKHVDDINRNTANKKVSLRRNNTEQAMEQSPADNWDSVQLSASDRNFIEYILENGFVLAGPFVDSCINRRYVLNSLDESFWRLVSSNFYDTGRFRGISFDGDDNDHRRHVLSQHFGHFLDDKNIGDFMEYLLTLFVTLEPRKGFPDEQWLKSIEPIIEVYDLKRADPKFKELVAVRDGELFLRVMKLPQVVDVYSSSPELLETLVTELKDSEWKIAVNFATSGLILTFKGSDFFYRFIKMGYGSFRDILAGIDLDCNRVALRFDKGGEVEFAAPEAYINAVKYNICLVNPCNDSSNYFHEVGSAHFRGYTIYLTRGMIALSGTSRDWNELDQYDDLEPQMSLCYELRTVKDTNSVYVPEIDEYLTQKNVVDSCQAVNYQVNNYIHLQLSRKFDILYPLVKKFSQSSWFRIRSRDPIKSMYVNYHRDNFLIRVIVYFYRNNSKYRQRGNYDNPSYSHLYKRLIPNIGVPEQFIEVFKRDALDRQKQQDNTSQLLSLAGQQFPVGAVAQAALNLRQNDLIILDNMANNAISNMKELEEEQRITSKEGKREGKREGRGYEEEDEGRILDDSIFEAKNEAAAEAAESAGALSQRERI